MTTHHRQRVLFAAAVASMSACGYYDGPPRVTLAGQKDGLLPDTTAPIVLAFSKPPDPKTLKVAIGKYLGDVESTPSDDDPTLIVTPLFSHDPRDGDADGVATLDADGKHLTIVPTAPLPAGGQLVIELAPGLADLAGNATRVRKQIIFGYDFKIACNAPSKVFQSGVYFFLVDVLKPIGAQVRMFAAIDVDPATGAFRAQFTDARRNAAPNRCPMPCASTEVCRLLPKPACVAPSEKAVSFDEFPDFVAVPDPPIGFSFFTTGCIVDQDDHNATFANAPVDVEVTTPHVTLRNSKLKASFTLGTDGIVRGAGTLTADDVLLGTFGSGQGAGNISGRSITAAEAPAGLPQPSAKP